MVDAVCNTWDVVTFHFPVSQYTLSWAICLTLTTALVAAGVKTLAANVRVKRIIRHRR